MAHCINTNSPEYKNLKTVLGNSFPEAVLKATIAVWQERNGLENWPTLQDLSILINKPNFVNIKQGVSELFESNPELANAVYFAMGLTAINESEITYTDEEGNLCAKMGGRSSKFTKGSQWEVVKDLKGYPSHAQGGVDIKFGKNGFSFTRDNGVIEAKHGLILPKIK